MEFDNDFGAQYDTEKFCDDYHGVTWIAPDSATDEVTENSHSLGKLYIRRLMKWLHEEFSSGRHKGKRLLDLCSGPNIHSVISASRCFDEIVLCDLGRANLRALHRWIGKDEAAYDWTEFFQFVAEMEEGGTTSADVELRTRQAVRSVYQCDLRKNQPFGDVQSQIVPVDCITAVLAIQMAASSKDEHRAIFKRITGYLKPGGSLVAVVVISTVGNYYIINGTKYYVIHFDFDELLDMMTGLGYVDIRYISYPTASSPQNNPGRYYIFISAHI